MKFWVGQRKTGWAIFPRKNTLKQAIDYHRLKVKSILYCNNWNAEPGENPLVKITVRTGETNFFYSSTVATVTDVGLDGDHLWEGLSQGSVMSPYGSFNEITV